jgi:hypothetical protein
MQATPTQGDELATEVTDALTDTSKSYRHTVLRLLRSVPARHLRGLRRVVLRDSRSLTPAEIQKRRRRERPLLGTYYPRSRSSSASIDLFMDAVLGGWPRWLLRLPCVRDTLIARVLFHEIAHHVLHSTAPQLKGAEASADAWAREMSRTFFRRRYWYLVPVLAPSRLLWSVVRRLLKEQRQAPRRRPPAS